MLTTPMTGKTGMAMGAKMIDTVVCPLPLLASVPPGDSSADKTAAGVRA